MFDFNFRHPHLLWLLLLVPALLGWVWRRRRSAGALRFPVTHALSRAPRGFRARLLWLSPALLAASLAFGVVGLARPQLSASGERKTHVEGIDVAIAIDLSASMQATDLKPRNRLQVAKEVLTGFLSSRVNDRVALVVFSGKAYTQVPLTLDYGVLKQVVSQLKAGVLEDGTAIGDAIGVGLNRLRESTAKSRALVLITDGDNNAGRLAPSDAAQIARELHIPVFPILIGKGGKVSLPVGKTATGEEVWDEVEAPVNEALLQQLATDTGGAFYRATDRGALERGLNSVLNRMERTRLTDGGATSQPQEKFVGFFLFAAALGALELLLRSTLLRVTP